MRLWKSWDCEVNRMNITKLQNAYFALYEKGKHYLIARNIKSITEKNTDSNFTLSKEQERQARDFWKPYYGKFSTVFHSFYTNKNGVFAPEYLPTDIYLNVVDEYFNSRVGSHVMDNKCYYPILFGPANICQPKTVAMRMNGFWYDENMSRIDKDALRERLNQQSAVFVKKATYSYGGLGVLYIDSVGGEIYAQTMESTKNWQEDIVIQQPVKQHALIGAINESSVNTLRIISLLTDEGVKIYTTLLRMGVAGAKVDNGSSGGIACGIADDGCLKKFAYRVSGEKMVKHPTSGLVFEGYKLPGMESARQLVEKAHPMLPHFRLATWDIAIDEQGNAVMIEVNLAKGGLEFPQLTNGPLFGADTKKILDEVFGLKE